MIFLYTYCFFHINIAYLDDNGNLTPMETQYSNGKIIWSTGHFSDYIILYKEPVNDSGEYGAQT